MNSQGETQNLILKIHNHEERFKKEKVKKYILYLIEVCKMSRNN